ncbi:MAG: hypothetical protein ACRDHF_13860 [Tepidiformaceae bacterium]
MRRPPTILRRNRHTIPLCDNLQAAMDFYEAAIGAVALYRLDGEDGASWSRNSL